MENLARYIIRASFSQKRMNYVGQESKVIYMAKDGTNTKEFDATDFIASLASHISNKSEQMVRYLGFYSNVCLGKRKKASTDEADSVIADNEHTMGCNKSWARLIKKIYEVDPLTCPIWRALHIVLSVVET